MKRLSVMVMFVLLAAPLCGRAREPRTQANHSVTLNILGVDYAYERPLGRKTTIIGRTGVNFGAAWYGKRGGDWRTGTGLDWGQYFMIAPAIEVEPRWYYGLDRRERHGRSTAKNASSFLSLKLQSVLPELGYVSDGHRMVGTMTFSPTWGLRRVWAEQWMFEFTTGIRFGVTHDGYWWSSGALSHLDLNVRFGYRF